MADLRQDLEEVSFVYGSWWHDSIQQNKTKWLSHL